MVLLTLHMCPGALFCLFLLLFLPLILASAPNYRLWGQGDAMIATGIPLISGPLLGAPVACCDP